MNIEERVTSFAVAIFGRAIAMWRAIEKIRYESTIYKRYKIYSNELRVTTQSWKSDRYVLYVGIK